MLYLTKIPAFVKRIFPKYIWGMSGLHKKLYLTFDDGPHPIHTAFVLDELKKYKAKATFFCIGKNVLLYPDMYKRILDEGHRVGNHTHNHLNGSKTNLYDYVDNVNLAKNNIDSNLFRPPYGRVNKRQASILMQEPYNFKIVMWDVLSADFDEQISNEKCLNNVFKNSKNGSIVLFHDSEKAATRMSYALPKVLEKFCKDEFEFCTL